MDVILSRENILLAYRNIKSNTGSITPGTDKLKISDIGKLTADEVTARVRKIVKGAKNGYTPRSVRRKDIPKPNGNTRPLGIPCIWDRLVQQCIKQVMEPICEARFSNNSYGFRPNRSVENAIAATYRLMQKSGLHYVVEFDIKGFFDNVDHRGFTMSVAFDSMWKTYTLTLKGQMTHRVELGSDARGNLVRIENALDKMPERLRSVQEQLENLYNQQAAAKAEVGKPFPQEQELAAKTARLIELDMELNLDGKGQPQPEQAIAKSARPSVLDRLKAPPVHGAPEKPHKKEMEAR